MSSKAVLLILICIIIIISGCINSEKIITGKTINVSKTFIEIPAKQKSAARDANQPQNSNNTLFALTVHNKSNGSKTDIFCPPTTKTCPDGFVAECMNFYLPDKKRCTSCEPDCSEHCKPCGRCEVLNKKNCTCIKIFPCDGNGICEEGEYPHSSDCPSCDDQNPCTEDIYNYTLKKCIHIPICNHKNKAVIITEIMYDPVQNDHYNEWIEIYNNGSTAIDLNEWKLCNKTLLPGYVNHQDGKVYRDRGTVLNPKQYALITDGGTGTDVYTNFNVSNDSLSLHVDASSLCNILVNSGEENVTLQDNEGHVADWVYYVGNGTEEGLVLKRVNNKWVLSENITPGY